MSSQIYISPDGYVLAVKEVTAELRYTTFNDPVYSLEKGKWYKLGRTPTNTHYRPNKETVFIQQKNTENTTLLVPHNMDNFLTIQQWREGQIDKLID